MIAASATAASLLPCPLVPVPTAAAALVETEKGVVFSQRGGPPPSLPLVPHSLGASKVQLSVLACAVRSAGAGVGRGLRCSLRFSHDRMAGAAAAAPCDPLRFAPLHHFNFSPSTSPLFSLCPRLRDAVRPSFPSLHLIIFVHCGDFLGPPWRPSTSYSHGDRLTAEGLQCGSEPGRRRQAGAGDVRGNFIIFCPVIARPQFRHNCHLSRRRRNPSYASSHEGRTDRSTEGVAAGSGGGGNPESSIGRQRA